MSPGDTTARYGGVVGTEQVVDSARFGHILIFRLMTGSCVGYFRGMGVLPLRNMPSRVSVLALFVLAGCFNFRDLEIAGVGGRCGDSDHWCQTDLKCVKKICIRDGGGIAEDKCSNQLPCSSAFACEQGTCIDPCKTVTCGDHGACVTTNNVALCVCDSGFANEQGQCASMQDQVCGPLQSCLSGLVCNNGHCAEACNNTFCTNGQMCDKTQLPPACACPAGMTWSDSQNFCLCDSTHVYEQQQCVGVAGAACNGVMPCQTGLGCNDGLCDTLCGGGFCGGGKTCDRAQQPAACVCPIGIRAEGDHCVDPCAGVNCSGLGMCVANNGVAVCNCNAPYVASGLECELPSALAGWTTREISFAGMNVASFVIRSNETFVAAINEAPGTVTFRLSNGTGWTTTSAPGNLTTGLGHGVQLGLGPGDKLAAAYVGYHVYPGGVSYVEWSGTTWVGNGGAGNGVFDVSIDGDCVPIFLAFDSTGMPAVGCTDVDDLGYEVARAYHWNGTTWARLETLSGGGTGFYGYGEELNTIAIDQSDNIYIGWFVTDCQDNQLMCGSWYIGRWSSVNKEAGRLDFDPPLSNARVAFGSNSMAIAYTSGRDILVQRQWSSAAPTTVVNGGTGGASVLSMSVAVDAQNAPIIAWDENFSAAKTHSIYARRWNGSAWVELGMGSSSGLGLAAEYSGAANPSLKVFGNKVCVGFYADASRQTFVLKCIVP